MMEHPDMSRRFDESAALHDLFVSVVVPVYNSQDTLVPLVDRISETLGRTAGGFEVILVNDGSNDRSWGVIQELAAARSVVRGVNLMKNYGQHNALLCGIRAATGDIIVTLDDDLQNPPEEIPNLIRPLLDGADVVYGTSIDRNHSRWRNIGSLITKVALQSSMGAETASLVGPFRAFRTAVRDGFASYRGEYVSIDVLLTWGTRKFTSVDVPHHSRSVGRSNYTMRKLLTLALNMLTGFSVIPLQLASVLGFSLTLVGAVILIYVIGRTLIQESVPGFPFLASIIAIFSGAQLFALGIMGEYLARMHFRLLDRPTYVVRNTVEPNEASVGAGR